MNVKDGDWGWSLLGQSLSLMPDGGKVLATSAPSYCSPVVVGLSQISLIASELFRQSQVSFIQPHYINCNMLRVRPASSLLQLESVECQWVDA